jgi:hypothetical protein
MVAWVRVAAMAPVSARHQTTTDDGAVVAAMAWPPRANDAPMAVAQVTNWRRCKAAPAQGSGG